MSRQSVLVVAAHPDDEVLGCGGTIARLVKEGLTVNIAILGEGITSREDHPTNDQKLISLKQDCRNASSRLGVNPPDLFDLPDNRFDTLPLLEIVKIVESLIEKYQPGVLFTHHGSDLNIDHAVTSRAVLTATRPHPGQCVRDVYLFEIPSSTEWGFQKLGPTFNPALFYNIGAELPAKIEALQAYKSEIREYPHPRSEQAVVAAARHWGNCVGYEAVEPFEIVRIVHA